MNGHLTPDDDQPLVITVVDGKPIEARCPAVWHLALARNEYERLGAFHPVAQTARAAAIASPYRVVVAGEWWDSDVSRSLEDTLAMGGTRPSDVDGAIGELLRRVAKIETLLAGAAMAYFRPADDERAAELEALISFYVSFETLIDLWPRFVEVLPTERQDWVARHASTFKAELTDLRNFRNALVHGDLWWDYQGADGNDAPKLKVYSYSRRMKLNASEITNDIFRDWIGLAADATTVVGQVHYWLSAPDD